jgi:fructoselysine 6-phosphate deglycase
MSKDAPEPNEPNYLEGTTLKDALHDIWTRESGHIADTAAEWVGNGLDHLYFVGCGGSLAISEPARWLMDRYSNIPASSYNAWEFVTRAPYRLGGRSGVVLSSHSGTTEEVMLGMKLARERGSMMMSMSRPGTPLSIQAGTPLTYDTPPVSLDKLYLSYLIAANFITQAGDKAKGKQLLSSLEALPEKLHAAKESTREHGRALAARYKDEKGFYVVGIGPLGGLNYQFSVCILMEMQWLHAAAINAGEFRHGPYEIVEPGVPMIHLIGTDESRPVAEKALDFSRRYGAETLVFDLKDMPGIEPDLAPFGIQTALQWFAWYLAVEHKHPLTTRRYMWKVPY